MTDETGAARVRELEEQLRSKCDCTFDRDNFGCQTAECKYHSKMRKENVNFEARVITLQQRLAEVEEDMRECYNQVAEWHNALYRENQELKEWQRIVIGAGTDQESVIRMAAAEYTKTAVQCWKKKLVEAERELAAARAERDRKQEGMDVLKAEMLRLRDKWEARLRVLEEQALAGRRGEVPPHWPKRHNACTDPCDVISGPCACGAWHNLDEPWVEELTSRYGVLP